MLKTIILTAILVGRLTIGWSQSNLMFQSSFEDATWANSWELNVCCSYSAVRTDSISRKGSYSVRIELDKISPQPSLGYRSELVTAAEPNPYVERWYGFSIFLPSNYVSDPADEILAQWHDTPDASLGELSRSPPISLLINQRTWHLNILWAANPVNTDLTASGTGAINLGACTTGQWTDWVFHLKFSYQSDGLIQIWKNGVLIANRNGPNYYNDKVGPYFKTGIYKWVWSPDWAGQQSIVTQRVIYIDNVRQGNQSAKFADVDPSK